MRLEIHALIGSTTALETRYDVSTQVDSSRLAERPPAMCGSATLAMLVSSTSMKVARVTVSPTSHGLWRGRQFTSGWASAGMRSPGGGRAIQRHPGDRAVVLRAREVRPGGGQRGL